MRDIITQMEQSLQHRHRAHHWRNRNGQGDDRRGHSRPEPRPASRSSRSIAARCLESLLESELFGHVKGLFTGAYKDHQGRFESANGGTLFLDEIGEMSPSAQVRLLRVLQEGEFERVGSSHPVQVDVRVIAATNRDLHKMVREGKFRRDLLYRINVFNLRLPPLRERRGDIPLLAQHFIEKYAQKNGKNVRGLGQYAYEALENYDWPGNVRELENVIEHGVILACGDLIRLATCPKSSINPARKSRIASKTAARSCCPGMTAAQSEGILIRGLGFDQWDKQTPPPRSWVSTRTLYRKIKEHNRWIWRPMTASEFSPGLKPRLYCATPWR